MCAISYYLERAGIMTTGISLVRENAEALAPPRSLWVTFPLGRPLGKPNDAYFQHKVIAAGLDLLTRSKGPVLEDFPLDAPDADESEAAACPVSFPKVVEEDASWSDQLTAEIALLRTWYELGHRRRGRTTVGVSGTPLSEIGQKIGSLLDTDTLPTSELKWFKHVVEDAKAYYSEALTAQPGNHSFELTQKVFWQETRMGAAFRALYNAYRQHPNLSIFARLIAPRDAIGGSTGEEIEIEQSDLKQ